MSCRSPKTKERQNKVIVVGTNNKSNGPYLVKLGYRARSTNNQVVFGINTKKIGIWLNKGVRLKSKVSWVLGLLSLADAERVKKLKLKK